ncbi:MAG: type II toxin-antitoxin system RelE/ParE family toxin [Inhella sp.]
MNFKVRFAPEPEQDLERLFDFLLERARSVEDLEAAQGLIDALRLTIANGLALTPYSFRKAGDGRRSTRRELIVPAGSTGYVALYEIDGAASVLALAVRHQLESDYH